MSELALYLAVSEARQEAARGINLELAVKFAAMRHGVEPGAVQKFAQEAISETNRHVSLKHFKAPTTGQAAVGEVGFLDAATTII